MARRAREAGSMADECVFHVNVNKLANKVCGRASGQRDRLTSTQCAVLTTTQEIVRASLRRSMDAGEDFGQSRSESSGTWTISTSVAASAISEARKSYFSWH